jgi:hypothetical protein
MSDPTVPTIQTQLPTYEYKAVVNVGTATADTLKALLDTEGAEGWLVICVAGQYFILARPTNSSINGGTQQPGQQPYPTPPYYYGR